MKGMKDTVQVSTPSLHKHDLSHTTPTTFDFYQFRPVLIQEMYPKDNIKVNVTDFFTAEPLAGKVYGRFFKKYAAFFVPHRIMWKNWNSFLTGGSSGRLEFDVPQVRMSDFATIASKMYDSINASGITINLKMHRMAVYRHMLDFWKDCGFPSEVLWHISNSAVSTEFRELDELTYPLWNFLACRHIWFDWFRDQNIIGDDVRDTYCNGDFNGIMSQDLTALHYESFIGNATHLLCPMPVGVEKDYFTTAMTEPQRGNAAFVPVKLPSSDLNPSMVYSNAADASHGALGIFSGHVGRSQLNVDGTQTKGVLSQLDYSKATDIIGMFDYTLIRTAKGVQKYLEKNNISGGSALQQLLAHWGTAPNPAVFNRSIYIGSFTDEISTPQVVSPLSTENGSSVAGEVVSRCLSNGNGTFEYGANEHGLFIIIQIARPENYYVGGIRRENMHGVLGNGRFDFFTDELEKTGFQPQYAFEKTSAILKAMASSVPFDASTGFVPRYAESKRQYNEYKGQLALPLNSNLRVCRSFEDYTNITESELFIGTNFTMVYGYPVDLQYDKFFAEVNPEYDHFSGWIHFDIELISERSAYSAPLIEDAKGNDITLPYAGVRM